MAAVFRLILIAILLLSSACGALPPSVPAGAYFPDPRQARTVRVSEALYRAARAAGEDPHGYSFALIQTRGVVALNAPDTVFYFSDGLANQPPMHIDAFVAQAVAHEVLNHDGMRRALSLGVTVGFTALGIVVPGLGLADFVVNPLVVRAFTRDQELAADRKAVEILEGMGHLAPRRMLASALTSAATLNGSVTGGIFAKQPDLKDRLAALEPLESLATFAAKSPIIAAKPSAPRR